MSNQFSSGKHSIAECDICGFRFKLKVLKTLVIKTKNVNIKACPTCWDPDHPQLQLGMYPVEDPQAVRNPRPDLSYWQSGNTGLQVDVIPPTYTELGLGGPSMGSRNYQWGWNPVGFNNALVGYNIENDLLATGQVGDVTVVITAPGPGPGPTPGAPVISTCSPPVVFGTPTPDGGHIIGESGFTGATSVVIGGVSVAPFTIVSDTEIVLTYPTLSAGTIADVTVTNPYGSDTLAGAIHYF